MANISYIRLLNTIEYFSKNHRQVRRFGSDFVENLQNFATDTEQYPILYVVPNDSIFNENTTTFTIDIYCLDIIQKDRSNINNILSDTNLILLDLKKWILDGEVYVFDVLNNPTVTPLNNALLDYCAGWFMTLEVDCPTYGVCEIPFIDEPVVLTEINNIVYPKVLTCESLADCSTFIDAIDNRVPYINADKNVDLGLFGLTSSSLQFSGLTNSGLFSWNDNDGTANLTLKGGNVTLQLGQEQVLRVVNKTLSNITLLESNYQVVRVTGAQGNRLKVDLALATTDAFSAETIGIVTETILNNQEGFITTSGLVRGINTTGSIQGESWIDGDMLYLSPYTSGQLTNVKPSAPNHLVIIGYVVRAHITQGEIFIKVDNGYELDELHNVKITGATNSQVLTYDSNLWVNKTIIEDAIVDGVTDIAPSQNAVFDALETKQDILTNPITGTGTTNFVSKFTGPTSLGDSQIFDNGTNVIVGGTTTTSSAIFQIDSTTKGFLPPRMTTVQKNAITSPTAGLIVYDTTDNKHYGFDGTSWKSLMDLQEVKKTVELMDSLNVDFYAGYDLKINTITAIVGTPTTIIVKVNGSTYTLGNLISQGDKITVEVDVPSVINLEGNYE